VSHRPLALVSVLALGDYMLWNWSLQGNHDVLALVSGLTLPPLVIACLWLLALTLLRLIADIGRRSRAHQRAAAGGRARPTTHAAHTASGAIGGEEAAALSITASDPSSGKLAA
jgi:hypothetical protein